MDLNGKTIAILGGWTAYVIFWLIKAEEISAMIASSNIVVGIALYLLGNPAYLLIIYGILSSQKYKHRMFWKRIVASLLVVLGLDFVTLPRLAITDMLTDGISRTTNIGSIVMRGLESFVPHTVAFYIMYVILPIVMVAIAIELLGITNFIREHVRKRI